MNFVTELQKIKNEINIIIDSAYGLRSKSEEIEGSYKTPFKKSFPILPIVLDESLTSTHDPKVVSVALSIFMLTESATTNQYLREKKIKPQGLKEYDNHLVVPLRLNGCTSNLQIIDQLGNTFLLDERHLNGECYVIGEPGSTPIIIGTDVIEVISAHQSTGYMSVVAAAIENLEKVLKNFRQDYPLTKIIILANPEFNLKHSTGNTLLKKMLAADTYVAYPSTRGSTLTFNQLLCGLGEAQVLDRIEQAELVDESHSAKPDSEILDLATSVSEPSSVEPGLLAAINGIFKEGKANKMFSRDLVIHLKSIEDVDLGVKKTLTQKVLANLLKPFNIESKKIRIGNGTGRGYVVEQFPN